MVASMSLGAALGGATTWRVRGRTELIGQSLVFRLMDVQSLAVRDVKVLTVLDSYKPESVILESFVNGGGFASFDIDAD